MLRLQEKCVIDTFRGFVRKVPYMSYWRFWIMQGEVAAKGKKYYDEHLKQILEPEHNGEFVTLDPESGQYFLGNRRGSNSQGKTNAS